MKLATALLIASRRMWGASPAPPGTSFADSLACVFGTSKPTPARAFLACVIICGIHDDLYESFCPSFLRSGSSCILLPLVILNIPRLGCTSWNPYD